MAPILVEILARLALSAISLLIGWALVGWGRYTQDARARIADDLARSRESENVSLAHAPADEPGARLADDSTVVLISQVPGDWRELDDA